MNRKSIRDRILMAESGERAARVLAAGLDVAGRGASSDTRRKWSKALTHRIAAENGIHSTYKAKA